MSDEQKTAFEFPCEFPLKVIGKNSEDFHVTIVGVIRKHVSSLRDDQITGTISGNGKYRSLTVTFTAESKEQLDALYHELHAHDLTIMVM